MRLRRGLPLVIFSFAVSCLVPVLSVVLFIGFGTLVVFLAAVALLLGSPGFSSVLVSVGLLFMILFIKLMRLRFAVCIMFSRHRRFFCFFGCIIRNFF